MIPHSLPALVEALTYPPALSACVLLCAALALLLRWRKIAAVLAIGALAWSALWSVPAFSDGLRHTLEQRHHPVAEAALPQVDAIVVLGGGRRYGWLQREDVSAEDLPSSRLAAGARAWLDDRAPVVVLSGGGRPGHTEAMQMARAITRLGVPRSALLLEQRSRDTRQNAEFTAQLAREHDIHRVLLVTSAVHMPRASLLFRATGLGVVPVPVPELARRGDWQERWLPSRSALWRSGRALREYAALLRARTGLLTGDDYLPAVRQCKVKTVAEERAGFSRG